MIKIIDLTRQTYKKNINYHMRIILVIKYKLGFS
jgi:hypothetical protein